MTRSNPLHTEEIYEAKNSMAENSDSDKNVLRNARWGAILLVAAGLAFFGFAISVVNFHDWEDYILVGFPLVLACTSLASIYLMQHNRLALGSGIVFSLNLLLPLILTIIVADTLGAAFYYAAVSSALVIWQAMPRRSWRWSTITTGIILAAILVINLYNPPNRFSSPSGFDIFVAFLIATLSVAFVTIAALQAWKRNNIRSRYLTFSLGLTLIAATVIAGISVSSLLSAGKQAQEASSQVLRKQAQDALEQQVIEFANQNELVLQSIGQDAGDVARQTATILENPNAFNTEAYWKADEHMFLGGSGQYINSANDVSTAFVPNTVRLTDSFKKHLELLSYLDMIFVPVYEGDPNSVAIYFVGKDEISWLYPNINLGSLVPPDYLATQDIFYTTGSPENNPERKVVWTPVYDDPGGQGLLVSAIAPVYTSRNAFMGIIGIDVSLAGLTTSIEQKQQASGGYSFLLDADGRALALPEQGYLDFLGREREADEFGVDFAASAQPEFVPLISDMLTGATGFQSINMDNQELFVAYTTLGSTGWHVASVVNAEQVLAPATALQTQLGNLSTSLVFQRIVPIGLVFVILVAVAGIFFTNRLVKPIEQLTEGATKIGQGEWDTPLPQSELREIDGLSHTLSTMSAQLKNTLGTLEQRVADRTRNLELAAEVGRTVSQVRGLDVMLKDACELILKEFNLYYVQVYLTDPSQTNLVLEAGTGEVGAQLVGRGHSLPLNTGSINGRAAVERHSVVISDTAISATFHPNKLLPDTRGEMAVPLIVGDKVVGVLDMQSSNPGVLTDEILPAFEALAGQMAVAVQNANLLAETEQARAQVESQARRLVRKGWSEHLDAIHKPEQLGFVFDHNQVAPLADMDEKQMPDDGKSVSAPIALTGEALGSLVVELDDEARAEQTSELVSIVARQVAQQIETLRLLESAERYRAESERAVRLQTIEGWQSYISSRPEGSLGYLYDTKEVRPQMNGKSEDASMFALPLKARDEMIGKLSVQGLTDEDQESVELVNTVAERLSAHIENLRLFEETRQGQVELDKRARQLAAVAEITTASSKETDVQKMLESVVHLTQRKFGLYHAHVFIYDEEHDELKIRACGYKEGDEHDGTHGTTTIPLNKEQSLVARAARTRKAVIVNNVFTEPGWLPNPLLPDTASELAVPLIVGDRVLGVLDVQSDRIDAFTEEDANIHATLASQVATALQNAQSFNQAQSALAQSEKLFNASRKLTQATDLQQLVDTAVSTLNISEINRAILVSFNYDKGGDVDSLDVLANWWNGSGQQVTPIGTHYPLEVVRVMPMFVSPTPVFFNDAFIDERVDETTMQLVKRLNLRAVAVLPLHSVTGQIGALILEAEEPHNFTTEETRLFTAIAPQIATTVENRRQFESAQKQAERESMLNVINQKIQSATSVEAVLQIAARELGHALGAPMTIAQLSMKETPS